ncbi:aconitase family protein [Colletotrichum scovillei]|uniref:Aconitase family protein n=1 Tax=Colletotrichum scovillei TaxID=1209932 RepID=A0A9P7QQ89_9PEZI|nr:aconitase family protein [Colletotrichum scovillei]KAG7040553.1 aconitase family protein [Colletotrichum scovillei]KAG7060600.1 aconitase family protein [Colletotrichum scovillei]
MAEQSFNEQLLQLLAATRDLHLRDEGTPNGGTSDIETKSAEHPLVVLSALAARLQRDGKEKEAKTILQVVSIATASPDYGGMGLTWTGELSATDRSELILLTSAWLESLNSNDRRGGPIVPLVSRPAGRRPMNVTEKIFALHDVTRTGWVRTGDTIRVSVDWIMASEASWHGMLQVYNKLGDPGIFSNSNFWLAGDHVVDPRLMDTPLVQKLVGEMDFARKKFKMTQFQGNNYTIMHTEFYRERAQPGQIIIGSDSHTCSSGADGCLAIGLGATEVTMALVTGEIWFKVPEVVEIHLVGKPQRGVGGKDIILYILQQLKRNTVAADRVVEYTGPGCRWLSSDARFAIANMTTEFGGITGIFVPDEVTKDFIDARKTAHHRTASYYFKPDEGCSYAESHTIDVSLVEPFVAKYPSPDDVVPVSDVAGTHLDGVFIGACTTAEEDLVMGALVLQAGLDAGRKPVARGERRVVPGSRPIADYLRKTGLADIYERAGFIIGIPGCSYCVGMGADMAKPGEVWLSSQNRNFENRMGKGAIGSLASAATVAASSFDMAVTSPQDLIDLIPADRWAAVKGKGSLADGILSQPQWVEPPGQDAEEDAKNVAEDQGPSTSGEDAAADQAKPGSGTIRSKIFRLGDFVDTDALAPAQYLLTSKNNEELGTHCLEFTNPEFRQLVKEGHKVIVAGDAFGCGSSRQEAVQALLGVGVECVIAKAFAFIYSRNQPSLGLWGFTIDDPLFYEKAQTGTSIEIDLDRNVLTVDGETFEFQLSVLEKKLTKMGGMTNAFNQFGKRIYDVLTGRKASQGGVAKELKAKPAQDVMAW